MISDMLVKKFEVGAEHFDYAYAGQEDGFEDLKYFGMFSSTASIIADVGIIVGGALFGLGCAVCNNRKDFWQSMKICKHSFRDMGYSFVNVLSLGFYGNWKSNLNNPSWKKINNILSHFIDIKKRAANERENDRMYVLLKSGSCTTVDELYRKVHIDKDSKKSEDALSNASLSNASSIFRDDEPEDLYPDVHLDGTLSDQDLGDSSDSDDELPL